MKTHIVNIICLLLCFCSTICRGQKIEDISTETKAVHEQFISWLKNKSQPLINTNPGSGFADLTLFEQSIAKAEVVGLGEATHGTHEFFRMKHRLIELMVTKLGYNVFALEASYARCRYINDYVLHGKGSLDTAVVMQGFPTWRTEEFRDLISWLKNYNATQPIDKKVQFVGFDVQNNDVGSIIISNYLKTTLPDKVAEVDSLMAHVKRVEKNHGIYGGDTTIIDLVPKVRDLLTLFTMNKGQFVRETSEASYEEAWQHLRLILQYVISYSRRPLEWRDYYMAENVQYIHNHLPKGSKLIVWAHNDHVAKDYQYESVRSLGYYLRQAYSDRYVAIGFTFYQGIFRANDPDLKNSPDWEEQEVMPAPVSDLGWFYNQTGNQACYTVWRNAKINGTVEQWLSERTVSMYSIGSVFSKKHPIDNYQQYPILKERFDGMIFIKTSSPSRPLPNIALSIK